MTRQLRRLEVLRPGANTGVDTIEVFLNPAHVISVVPSNVIPGAVEIKTLGQGRFTVTKRSTEQVASDIMSGLRG